MYTNTCRLCEKRIYEKSKNNAHHRTHQGSKLMKLFFQSSVWENLMTLMGLRCNSQVAQTSRLNRDIDNDYGQLKYLIMSRSLEWRKQWNVDSLENWVPPKVLVDHIPHGLSGFDKDGAPIVITPFAGLDLYGILHVVNRKEMIKITIKTLEYYLKICREQAKKLSPEAGQVTVIFDMEDFNLKPYLWRPAGELVINLIQMYEANYPEILKVCFIINAPKVFALAFSIAKKFMNEYTISKIQIYKADPPRWQAALLKVISKDQLPAHFGGTLTDPDGNPRLTTKICQGGKVPKEMYLDKLEKEKLNENFTTVTIRKGDKLKLDIATEEVNSLLSWEFRSEEHDIKFGILKNENNGKQTEVVPIHRVAAHQMDEIGIFTCEIPGTYSVVFDNSYSLLRNKRIHYSLRILPPSETIEELTPMNS